MYQLSPDMRNDLLAAYGARIGASGEAVLCTSEGRTFQAMKG